MIIKRIQARLMLWLGRRLFSFVKTWAPKENEPATVMHFAHSERDFNIAVRQQVEELDDPALERLVEEVTQEYDKDNQKTRRMIETHGDGMP